jgi:hypothetical protein
MRTVIMGVIACFVLCGCQETTKYCDDACTIWEEQECWGYDLCMEDCREEKDWDKPYLDCLKRADGCPELEACG